MGDERQFNVSRVKISISQLSPTGEDKFTSSESQMFKSKEESNLVSDEGARTSKKGSKFHGDVMTCRRFEEKVDFSCYCSRVHLT